MDEKAVRRLLLDGVKILHPYLRALRAPANMDDSEEREAVMKEIALVAAWLRQARSTAWRLGRAHSASTNEEKQ